MQCLEFLGQRLFQIRPNKHKKQKSHAGLTRKLRTSFRYTQKMSQGDYSLQLETSCLNEFWITLLPDILLFWLLRNTTSSAHLKVDVLPQISGAVTKQNQNSSLMQVLFLKDSVILSVLQKYSIRKPNLGLAWKFCHNKPTKMRAHTKHASFLFREKEITGTWQKCKMASHHYHNDIIYKFLHKNKSWTKAVTSLHDFWVHVVFAKKKKKKNQKTNKKKKHLFAKLQVVECYKKNITSSFNAQTCPYTFPFSVSQETAFALHDVLKTDCIYMYTCTLNQEWSVTTI